MVARLFDPCVLEMSGVERGVEILGEYGSDGCSLLPSFRGKTMEYLSAVEVGSCNLPLFHVRVELTVAKLFDSSAVELSGRVDGSSLLILFSPIQGMEASGKGAGNSSALIVASLIRGVVAVSADVSSLHLDIIAIMSGCCRKNRNLGLDYKAETIWNGGAQEWWKVERWTDAVE